MTMGADLVTLAVDETRGDIRFATQLGYVLAAAELVDLAKARRIEAVGSGIRVVEALRTGDPVLDGTLERLAAGFKDRSIGFWIELAAPDRLAVHLAAMIESGELEGRLVRPSLNAPGRPVGLRVADSGRRKLLAEKLLAVTLHESTLEDGAFGALAFAAEQAAHIAHLRSRVRAQKRLKELTSWFADTWRYLPGVPDELALGDDDVEPGGVNPVDDEPWRLLIRLAVYEATKRAAQRTRKSESDNGLSDDVRNAALLAYAWDHGL